MHNLDALPQPVADALIKSLLVDVEKVIEQHGLSEVLVGLAMYCTVQSKAKFNKTESADPKDQEAAYYFRDAAKALEVAASLTYRTQQDPVA